MSDTDPTQLTLDGYEEPAAPAGPPPVVVDRSTLEYFATCPHMGHAIVTGRCSNTSPEADSGNEVHRIIAEACRRYGEDAASPFELREYIRAAAMHARPDVQPDVYQVLRNPYPLVEQIVMGDDKRERSHEDLKRYDGGEGLHRGQLAFELIPAQDGRSALHVTAELDLLLATPSPRELELKDWKSGRKWWTPTMVRESFQFGTYTWLIFACYPKVDRVRVVVFMPREGVATSPVYFDRDRDMLPNGARILSAARLYLEHRDATDPAAVPCWPAEEKCVICPAARRCREAHVDAREVNLETEWAVRGLAAQEAKPAMTRRMLTVRVRELGEQRFPGDPDRCLPPIAYGTEKPRETKKARACDVYIPDQDE